MSGKHLAIESILRVVSLLWKLCVHILQRVSPTQNSLGKLHTHTHSAKYHSKKFKHKFHKNLSFETSTDIKGDNDYATWEN